MEQILDIDVAVLGGGLAGHCAALAAAERGVSVLLLEKCSEPGGSTVTSAGSFALAGTDLQAAVGVQDSPQQLAEELMRVSGGHAEPALVQTYVEGQAETYEWLKRQGVLFHKISLSSSTNVPRTHPTNSRQLIAALHEQVMKQPLIRYLPNTRATRLEFGGDGRVQGVHLQSGEHEYEARVRGGVVIATGGFSRSPELIRKFAPELINAPAWGGAGNEGDGLKMAWALGADVADMGFVNATFGVAINHYPDTEARADDELLLRMAMYRGGIAVNLDARRFADESQSYKKLATACLAQPRGIAFQIFDQAIMDQSVPNPSVNDLHGAFEKGVVKRADSWSELARQLGIDGPTLQATVERYNGFVAAGQDLEFGRQTLGGGFGKPVALGTAPFYGLPCSAAVLSTYAGVRVSPSTQVQNVFGDAIEGLYAAGEVVGGFHGEGYMSGSSLGKAAIFGRIAGRQAASRAAARTASAT